MLYSDLLQSTRADGDLWRTQVPEDWMQGRSVFGGLQSALAVHAMRALVPEGMPLRTLQTTFIDPIPVGDVCVRAQVLRTGKSAIHVLAHLLEGERILCIVIGVFGAGRASKVAVTPTRPVVENSKPISFPFIQGVTPNFTQHFSMRWLRGTPPFTNNPETRAVIEAGIRDSGPATDAHVLAIADVIPPLALSMLKTPANGSSLTWMIEFFAERFDTLPLLGWRIDVELIAGRDGYTSQSAMIWSPGGEAVAISRQSMVVFG